MNIKRQSTRQCSTRFKCLTLWFSLAVMALKCFKMPVKQFFAKNA